MLLIKVTTKTSSPENDTLPHLKLLAGNIYSSLIHVPFSILRELILMTIQKQNSVWQKQQEKLA